jgi:uncharacterized protein (DUF2141 family)
MPHNAYVTLAATLLTFVAHAATAAQDSAPAAIQLPANPPADAPVHEGACDEKPFSMQITVQSVREATGTITVDVHDDDPAKFLKSGGKLARIRVPAVKGETHFCIVVPHAGIYALAIYHDRNGNTKLDKTWIGLPGEPFGLSNNPPKRLAMPKHKDSAFEVKGPLTPVVIDLDK